MGPLFEKEAFGLNKNELSKVVKTEAGFEIIKLLDVVDSKQKTFDEVKAEVEKLYRNEQAEKLFLEQSDKLQTLAFENESSLDGAADAIGAKVLSSDWIERGMVPDAKNVFTSPEIIAAAFSDDVLTAGRNSELIEIDSATVAVVRLQEHQTPKQKPLADVQDSIKSSLQNQKLRKLLIEKGELALKALRESGEWSALEVIGVSATQVESSSAIKRDNNKLSPSVVDKLFSMQKPGADKRSFDNVILPDGDYVLIALTGVKDGTSDIDSSLQKSFTQMLSTREQAAVLKSLREQAEVELFPENIQ
jgi:peptidyl-prolyl cis-trans isomerase D